MLISSINHRRKYPPLSTSSYKSHPPWCLSPTVCFWICSHEERKSQSQNPPPSSKTKTKNVSLRTNWAPLDGNSHFPSPRKAEKLDCFPCEPLKHVHPIFSLHWTPSHKLCKHIVCDCFPRPPSSQDTWQWQEKWKFSLSSFSWQLRQRSVLWVGRACLRWHPSWRRAPFQWQRDLAFWL